MPQSKEYYHDVDLKANQLFNSRLHNITTAARTALGIGLTTNDKGYMVYDTDLSSPYFWDGVQWNAAGGGGGTWGSITGTITAQTDLITYLSTNYYPVTNPAGYITSSALSPYLTSATAASTYVPLTRNITINGTTYDLSADRTWTVSGLPSQATHNGQWLTTDGTNASWAPLSGNISQFTNNSGYINYIPTLQQVVTAGDRTVEKTITVTATGSSTFVRLYDNQVMVWDTGVGNSQAFLETTGFTINNAGAGTFFSVGTNTVDPIMFVNSQSFTFPTTASGKFAISVNGITPNAAGNITVPTGTGTVTGTGVATRVAFWDGTTSLNSNSNLYWDNTNNRLGIGTSSPTYKLDVNGIINTNTTYQAIYGNNASVTGIDLTNSSTPSLSWFKMSATLSQALLEMKPNNTAFAPSSFSILSSYDTTLETTQYSSMLLKGAYGLRFYGGTNLNAGQFLDYYNFYTTSANTSILRVSHNSNFVFTDSLGDIQNAVLNIKNNSKGVILPQLTTAERNAIPLTYSLTITNGGSGYLPLYGSYNNIPLTGGSGTGAIASINIGGGVIDHVVMTSSGTGYLIGDVLSLNNSYTGGAGSGVQFTVNQTPNGMLIYNMTTGKHNYWNGTAWIEVASGTGVGTVTSVGLSMPSAFTVASSPVTGSGTIAVTGAGTTAQYVKGDGSLGTTVTKTSELTNDGDNGYTHFISVEDLPSNLTLYATNVASGINTYTKAVSSITDPDFNTVAVNIPVGPLTSTTVATYCGGIVSSANIIVGNPGIFTMSTIGSIRRTAGTAEGVFFYEVYKRDAGGTETLIVTSANTFPVSSAVYVEFNAAALFSNGVFTATDRIVIKFYGLRLVGGSNPSFEFQFGGIAPVRTTLPIPLTVTPIPREIISISTATAAGSIYGIDYIYLVSGTTTLTLPTAVGNVGIYNIKRVGTGVVSIATTSSQTIDGSASPITINVQYVSITVVSDGANWNII